MKLSLLDQRLQQLCATCHVLLVLDEASGRPVGCWISPDKPGHAEVGLALYQSIWHPGILEWPLRGIPRTIKIPEVLCEQASSNLTCAAEWLLSDVQSLSRSARRIFLEKQSYTADLINRLQDNFPVYMRDRTSRDAVTLQEAVEGLLSWFIDKEGGDCFPNHRSPAVPFSCRQHGFGLPGFGSPAAGWLLPKTERATSDRNGISYNGIRYKSDRPLEPGVSIVVHQYPFAYAGMLQHVFLELPNKQLLYAQAGGA